MDKAIAGQKEFSEIKKRPCPAIKKTAKKIRSRRSYALFFDQIRISALLGSVKTSRSDFMSDVPGSELETHVDPQELQALCSEVTFAQGDALRLKGQHYKNMYVIVDGEVEITLEKKGKASAVLALQRGSPIGEISFLTGRPATANVVARTTTRALVIDDAVVARIERERPEFAASLYRRLADVAEGRQSFNLVFFEDENSPKATHPPVEIRLCRNSQMLHDAQRIRYEVYCEELGRTSPFADVQQRIIADDLDTFAHVLLALEGETAIGTMRLNRAKEGPLGAIEQIYGMPTSPHHPECTSVCTKFIVKKSHRYGQASFRLMSTSLQMGLLHGIKSCYIDCIPSLLPFYMSLGFRQSAAAFLHRENGRSVPLALDMDRYAPRITRLTGFALK
jgi:CRP-like cAMP-binding protein/predicted GNAT family N-acyltransferase